MATAMGEGAPTSSCRYRRSRCRTGWCAWCSPSSSTARGRSRRPPPRMSRRCGRRRLGSPGFDGSPVRTGGGVGYPTGARLSTDPRMARCADGRRCCAESRSRGGPSGLWSRVGAGSAGGGHGATRRARASLPWAGGARDMGLVGARADPKRRQWGARCRGHGRVVAEVVAERLRLIAAERGRARARSHPVSCASTPT